MLANGVSTPLIGDALQRDLDAYERNHSTAARVRQRAGDYSPTFGFLGVVLGLILATGHMLEPSQLGQGICVGG